MRAAFHGMALQVHGHHDLRLEFWREQSRDEVSQRLTGLRTGHDPH
jgi:sterol 3beta-glucosyltransferase